MKLHRTLKTELSNVGDFLLILPGHLVLWELNWRTYESSLGNIRSEVGTLVH